MMASFFCIPSENYVGTVFIQMCQIYQLIIHSYEIVGMFSC